MIEETAFASWRKRMKLTQREAAKSLGVTLPTYQSWEWEKNASGEHLMPPLAALLAAAAIEKNIPEIK